MRRKSRTLPIIDHQVHSKKTSTLSSILLTCKGMMIMLLLVKSHQGRWRESVQSILDGYRWQLVPNFLRYIQRIFSDWRCCIDGGSLSDLHFVSSSLHTDLVSFVDQVLRTN